MRMIFSTTPGTLMVICFWLLIWLLAITKDIAPILEGKGFSKVGYEHYRFFTAGLTHTHFLHLCFNVAAMFWIGHLYEERLGTIRFLITGVLCAVFAQVIFLCIYHSIESSIGGSVYTYALCGFGLTLQFLIPGFPKLTLGTWSGNWLVISMILSNFPILSFMDVSTFFVHLIAFVVGIVAAFLSWSLGLR